MTENSKDEAWGEWIVHDLSGCPCVGQLVEIVGSCNCQMTEITVAQDTVDWYGDAWLICSRCSDEGYLHISTYRIRKNGTAIINKLLADISQDDPADTRQPQEVN